MAMETNVSRSEVQTKTNTKSLNKLIANLTESENDIKDYHFMVEKLDRIGVESYDFEAEDGSDPELKWTKISDVFRGFGYPLKRFSANKCRDRFYRWSAFYAKNYDKINGILEPKCREIFDLLKIVHILDFKRIWIHSNPTHRRLKDIGAKREIKAYLIAYKKRQQNLENETKNGEMNGTVVTSSIASPYETVGRFEDMNLKSELLRGILGSGYKKPSYIQQRAIIPAIIGRDVIAQAQSGTGKTAAFAIAILQRIDTSIKECQALVMVSTHELAHQIRAEISQLSKYMNIKCHTSVGGLHSDEDSKALKRGPHIVIGTPGRVIHKIDDKALRTDYIKMFVLDECDQLLDLNGKFCSPIASRRFKNQIFIVYRTLKPDIQVFLSSATIPKEILKMTQIFMRSPVRILIRDEELTLRGLQQYHVMVEESHKFETFLDLYNRMRGSKSFESSKAQAFVYCNTRERVVILVNKLEREGITVAHTHGKMDEQQRSYALNDFRKGYSRVLITTDMLGRGIDVKEVEYVFNYDLPEVRETYMHRVGRSGRFGRTGKAINFVTEPEAEALQQIEMFYNTQIKCLPQDLSAIF